MGAEKAGTTWWYLLLRAHPRVHRQPHGKEVHFFDRFWNGDFSDADVHEYHRFFPRPSGLVTGEWTPDYMCFPWVPPLLASAAPDAKILMLLRDPLERFRSSLARHLQGSHQQGRAVFGHTAPGDALSRGLYAGQLRWLLRFFPRRQILVLQLERCQADPRAELRRTYEFLGLGEVDFVPADIDKPVNKGPRKVRLPPQVRRNLAATFARDVRHLQKLAPEIDVSLWPSVRDLVSRRHSPGMPARIAQAAI